MAFKVAFILVLSLARAAEANGENLEKQTGADNLNRSSRSQYI